MRMKVINICIVLSVASVFYFSWLPSPRLALSGVLPDWLSRWTDSNIYMNIRTAVPFVLLGLLGGLWVVYTKQPWYFWILVWLGLVFIVMLAEAGQLFLPLRHFDWGDVLWGASGALAGITSTTVTDFALRRVASFYSRH